jgi:hypothetical protein
MLLDDYKEVPYKVINFIGAEVNYGGRVTDFIDVRLIKTILSLYINKEVFFIISNIISHLKMGLSTLNQVYIILQSLENYRTILNI